MQNEKTISRKKLGFHKFPDKMGEWRAKKRKQDTLKSWLQKSSLGGETN